MDPIFLAYLIIFALGVMVLIISLFVEDLDVDHDGFAVSPFLIAVGLIVGGAIGMVLSLTPLHPAVVTVIALAVAASAYYGVWSLKRVLIRNQSNSIQ